MVPIWDVVGSGGGRGSEVWLVHTNPMFGSGWRYLLAVTVAGCRELLV